MEIHILFQIVFDGLLCFQIEIKESMIQFLIKVMILAVSKNKVTVLMFNFTLYFTSQLTSQLKMYAQDFF